MRRKAAVRRTRPAREVPWRVREETSAKLLRGVDLALEAGYVMGVERVRGVRARFPEPWAYLACVRELDERLRSPA